MRVSSVLFFVLMLVLLSCALKIRHSNKALDKLAKLQLVNSAKSNCGQVNCSSDNLLSCPNFAFSNSICQNNSCIYYPNFQYDICTDPSQCGSGECVCYSTGLSPGCKCTNDDECACYNGVCQLTSGYLGEYCDDDNPCVVGACNKTNQCALVPEGGQCDQDNDCNFLQYYCNATCTKRPLCNETSGEGSLGYCENYGECSNGICYPTYTQKQGGPCLDAFSCMAGLGCVGNGTKKTCEPIALGTTCNSDMDCAFQTQNCLCTQPDDSFPTVCSDTGSARCVRENAEFMECIIKYDCLLYDIDDMTTDCGKNCNPLFSATMCCSTCLYPEFWDNAQINVIGSCVNNNITSVNCCTDEPCVITTTVALCYGYKHD